MSLKKSSRAFLDDSENFKFPLAERTDKVFFDEEVYPQSREVHIRFQDIDSLGHVNNVAMGALFEDVRFHVADKLEFERFRKGAARILIANVQLTYLSEAYRGLPLIFHFGVGHIGSSSWRLHALAIQDGRRVFVGNSTAVFRDDTGAKTLPNDLVNSLQSIRLKIAVPT